MYRYLKAYVRRKQAWSMKDITDHTLFEIREDYHTVHLYITDGINNDNVLDIHKAIEGMDITELTVTVGEWVATLVTLPINATVQAVPLSKVGKMRVTDLSTWSVTYTLGNLSYGEGQAVPLGSSTDLIVRNSTEVDEVAYIQEHCLISINGYLLQTELVGDALIVDHASPYIEVSGSVAPVITVVDLRELGRWSWHVMDADELTVLPRTDTDRDRNRTRVLYEHMGMSDTTIVGVLDGTPCFLDGTFTLFDGNHVGINVDHRKLVRRERSNPTRSDVSGLTDGKFSLSRFDPIAYLSRGASAIIIFENPDVNVALTYLGRTGIPGEYISYKAPCGLALDSGGFVVDYLVSGNDEEQYAISTNSGYRKSYLSDMEGSKSYLLHGEYKPQSAVCDTLRIVDLYTLSGDTV